MSILPSSLKLAILSLYLLLGSLVDHFRQRGHPPSQLRGKLDAVHRVEALVDLIHRVQGRVVALLVDVYEGVHDHVHNPVALQTQNMKMNKRKKKKDMRNGKEIMAEGNLRHGLWGCVL